MLIIVMELLLLMELFIIIVFLHWTQALYKLLLQMELYPIHIVS